MLAFIIDSAILAVVMFLVGYAVGTAVNLCFYFRAKDRTQMKIFLGLWETLGLAGVAIAASLGAGLGVKAMNRYGSNRMAAQPQTSPATTTTTTTAA